MTPATLKALKASIAHWKRLETETARPKETIYGDACPLCKIFYAPMDGTCDGCPVKMITKKDLCRGSPWLHAHLTYQSYGRKALEFKAAAKKEGMHPL